jgi:two-component system, response regulator, stage 0 sporulation protein A
MEQISVMIADNSNEFTKLLDEYLSLKEDIKVAGVARDGTETLEMLSKVKPDVLLLDLIMPRIDGLEVLRRINVNEKKPSVFILSALNSEDIKKQAYDAGADNYFVKPFNMEDLVSSIRKTI